MTPAEICGIVFPDECPPSGVLNWTVPLPARPKPPVTPVPLPKVGSPTLRVLHISDTHVDPSYSEGSEANCNEPLCCHAADVPAAKQQRRIAGHWGAFHTCDIPPRTFEHMLKTVRDTQKFGPRSNLVALRGDASWGEMDACRIPLTEASAITIPQSAADIAPSRFPHFTDYAISQTVRDFST
ncbi:hypothetical protein HPB52_010995 [Rhipicephalus sanguineus]|uniref:Sphingomyelin phosphodiesterase n=1 Tax=Rhipicephalus sanguineus TaxID=34632 RepID=A0A9D4PLQ9_RHISA|nr:hypothetical protein HPB52_010995 [Rhipicephalus sanguineus]